MYDLFGMILLAEGYYEVTTVSMAVKHLVRLSNKFESELLTSIKALIHKCCLVLARLDG